MPEQLRFLWRFFKKKYIILVVLTSLLTGILGEAYSVLILEKQKSMVIDFNYPGVENGLNPDGSTFEIANLKSDEVINRAKEKLQNHNIDTDFLKSRIFITSKISSVTMDKIISSVQNEKNIVYLPTTFYVYYSQKNKFSKNESRLFMQSLAEAYTEYFDEKYSEKNDILIYNPTEYDFSNADYHEIYTILNNKVSSMLEFIKTHQQENRAFYSQDRINLGTAIKKLESFQNVNLEKFYSFIVQNGVSKNNSEYIKRVEYIISDKTTEYNKLQGSSDIAKEGFEKYQSNITATAFIPSIDSKHNYYMSRTKTGLDYITKQSYEDGMSASRALKEIEYYKSLKNKFAVPSNSEEIINKADTMINALSYELKQISDEVLKIDDEYLEHKTKNYLKIRLPEPQSIINIRFIIKCLIAGFIFSVMLVILWELFKNKIVESAKKFKKTISAIEITTKDEE